MLNKKYISTRSVNTNYHKYTLRIIEQISTINQKLDQDLLSQDQEVQTLGYQDHGQN